MKKSLASASGKPRQALIEQLRELMAEISVRNLCALLNIIRHWYSQHHRPSLNEDHDRSLCQALQELRKDVAGPGSRRMTKAESRMSELLSHAVFGVQ